MKLRIKGNSLRLRITPSELAGLLETGRIEDAVLFGADAKLIYALEQAGQASSVGVRYSSQAIVVTAPSADVKRWARSSEVGLYGVIDAGQEPLEIAIEKDFACLDKSEAENEDTFPNPHEGAVC